jgi:hypothetical protein
LLRIELDSASFKVRKLLAIQRCLAVKTFRRQAKSKTQAIASAAWRSALTTASDEALEHKMLLTPA